MPTRNAGNDLASELFSLITSRRSIRKYQDRTVSHEDMSTIIQAGLAAPNAGGRQGVYIVGINDPQL